VKKGVTPHPFHNDPMEMKIERGECPRRLESTAPFARAGDEKREYAAAGVT